LEALKHIPFLTDKDIADAVLYVLGTPAHVQVGRLDFMYRLRLRSVQGFRDTAADEYQNKRKLMIIFLTSNGELPNEITCVIYNYQQAVKNCTKINFSVVLDDQMAVARNS
jgi:hypothetical protein